MRSPDSPLLLCSLSFLFVVLAFVPTRAEERELATLPLRLLGDSPRVLSRLEIDVGWTAAETAAAGNPFDPEELAVDAVVTSPSGKSLAVFCMRTKREALLWCLDPAYDWPAGGRDEEPQAHSGGRVRIEGLDDGEYRVEWWDTLAGRAVQSERVRVSAGSVALDVPEFRVDLAARLKREAD